MLATVYPRFAAFPDLATATMRTTTSTIALDDIHVPPATLNVPLRVHNGATLASVTVTFKVGFDHATVVAPKVRVLRVDASGNRTPITLLASGADSSGFVTYVQAQGLSWYDSGNIKSMTVAVDPALAVIDVTLYSYALEIYEEDNIHTYPWQIVVKAAVDAASVGAHIYMFGTQTIDGFACTAGMRVLLKDQTYPYQNGIWTVSATQWTRATDSNTAALCPQGCAVLVKNGTVNAGLIYQLTSALSSLVSFIDGNAQAASTGNLTLSGGQTVDGVVLAAGNTCLVKDQTVPNQNGYYSVQAGAWIKISFTDPQPNTVTVDAGGTVNGGTAWNISGSSVTPAIVQPVVFKQGITSYGNYWIAASCAFTNIADMRFQ